jgi:hypothetical protein
MPSEPQPVPFVGINDCLREDFLFRVLHRVLESLPTSSAPSSAALTRALTTIPVGGFRQFNRAPRGLQARAAMSQFRASGVFIGRALEVWLEANRTLAAAVEEFLVKQEIPRERIQAEAGEFRDRWSLDEVLRLADLFCAEQDAADRDDVALLLCCLTSRAPVPVGRPAEAAEEAPSPDAAPAPAPAGENAPQEGSGPPVPAGPRKDERRKKKK